jgi:hypothetical protein
VPSTFGSPPVGHGDNGGHRGVTEPDDDGQLGAVGALVAAGRVMKARELVELAFPEGAVSGKSGARQRLRLSTAMALLAIGHQAAGPDE